MIDHRHHLDLVILLLEIILCDADCVNPNGPVDQVSPCYSQEIPEVLSHAEKPSIQDDVLLPAGMAPNV
jgi:hypothetical protein